MNEETYKLLQDSTVKEILPELDNLYKHYPEFLDVVREE